MRNKKLTRIIRVLTIICALTTFGSVFSKSLLMLYYSYKFNVDIKDASAVGIIGGSDGPTEIFIGSQSTTHMVPIIFAILTGVGVVYLIVDRKKDNHN
ncbi:MAG TPA: sodium ion-translocating decarboxylase subunit beta [Clostridiales bacterium]|nr:sodium ion-translocating decarboxylase subunit beta [Clostridiales bacterium]